MLSLVTKNEEGLVRKLSWFVIIAIYFRSIFFVVVLLMISTVTIHCSAALVIIAEVHRSPLHCATFLAFHEGFIASLPHARTFLFANTIDPAAFRFIRICNALMFPPRLLLLFLAQM
jgi:hypothetical protein